MNDALMVGNEVVLAVAQSHGWEYTVELDRVKTLNRLYDVARGTYGGPYEEVQVLRRFLRAEGLEKQVAAAELATKLSKYGTLRKISR